jgi:hypothetical protein
LTRPAVTSKFASPFEPDQSLFGPVIFAASIPRFLIEPDLCLRPIAFARPRKTAQLALTLSANFSVIVTSRAPEKTVPKYTISQTFLPRWK